MKKRLLITSIVMMLVVAVALSTATYAWFTSNASVTASSINMYAATNQAASIGISWTDSNYGTSITPTGPASTTYFAPTSISTLRANTALSGITWSSATIKDVSGAPTFNKDVITATNTLTYTWTDGEHTSFYIHNGSTANQLQSVTATATVIGDAADFIRIGFFKYDTSAGAFKLKAVIAGDYVYTAAEGTSVNSTAYYNAAGEVVLTGDGTTAIPANSYTRVARGATTAAVGTAEAEKSVSSKITDTAISTSVDLGGLDVDDADVGEKVDNMQLKVMVWMDGSALNDNTAGTSNKLASIVLHFDAARGTYTADSFGA